MSYAGVHAQTESVHKNCVLGRCAYLCSIVVLHYTSSAAPGQMYTDARELFHVPLNSPECMHQIGSQQQVIKYMYKNKHPHLERPRKRLRESQSPVREESLLVSQLVRFETKTIM